MGDESGISRGAHVIRRPRDVGYWLYANLALAAEMVILRIKALG